MMGCNSSKGDVDSQTVLQKTKMTFATIGNSNLQCSRIGLGCMGMSAFYTTNPITEEEGIDLIGEALKQGVNFFDTAALYGFGKNEELLGKAIKKYGREKFIVATKVPAFQVDENGGFLGTCAKKDYVKQSCYDSLKKLDIECIDLYYQHRMDINTPIEETVQAFKELIEEKKIKGYGLSEVAPSTLRRAHAVHPCWAVQEEWSLWTRDIESNGLLQTCRELGVSIVAYSPLGRGFLTGSITKPEDFAEDDWRKTGNPRFTQENIDHNIKMVQKLNEFAQAHGCTAGQIALAWLLHKGQDVFPIPGTRRLKYLTENNNSTLVSLSDEDLLKLSEMFPLQEIQGTRYPEAFMGMCTLDTKPLE